MISLDKINEFRDEVNSDKFVLSKYKMVNGKNQWGCICSAMDWITVAIEYILMWFGKEYSSCTEFCSMIKNIFRLQESMSVLAIEFMKKRTIILILRKLEPALVHIRLICRGKMEKDYMRVGRVTFVEENIR